MVDLLGVNDALKIHDLFNSGDCKNDEIRKIVLNQAFMVYQYTQREIAHPVQIEKIMDKVLKDVYKLQHHKYFKYKEIVVSFDLIFLCKWIEKLLDYENSGLEERDSYVLEDFYVEMLKHPKFEFQGYNANLEDTTKGKVKIRLTYIVKQN